MGQRYGLEIRAAAGTDAPGVATLLAEMGATTASPQALTRRIDAVARAGGTVLLALEWGPPSGVVALQVVTDLTSAYPAGLLVTLAVSPEARRRGIGRLLIKAAGRSARLAGCDRLVLPVVGMPPEVTAFGAATGFVSENGAMVRPLLRRGPGSD